MMCGGGNHNQSIQVARPGVWILLFLLLPSPSTPFLGRLFKSRSLKLVDDSLADDYFMQLAIVQAKRAAQCREVPVGCVIVQRVADGHSQQHRYRLLSQAHNRVEQLHDASAHAELLALRHAGRQLKNWRLSAPSTSRHAARTPPSSSSMVTTLYSTCEPCLTCWSACHAFRVQRIVYGTDDLRLGAVTAFRMNETSSTTTHHPFHTISELKGGVRKEECADLLRAFFRQRRKETSATKLKR